MPFPDEIKGDFFQLFLTSKGDNGDGFLGKPGFLSRFSS